MKKTSQGFTLIEIMIVVAIVSILMAIAIPSYRDYIQRGKIPQATNNLANFQVAMEQFYQDNRNYLTTSGFVSPCDTAGAVVGTHITDWSFTCPVYTSATYTIQATGTTALTAGFIYTVNQQGNQVTSAVPVSWRSNTATPQNCFLLKKGMSC